MKKSHSGLRLRYHTWNTGLLILVAVSLGAGLAFYLALAGPGAVVKSLQERSCIVYSSTLFYNILDESKEPLLAMFSSDSCPTCRILEPDMINACQEDTRGLRIIIVKLGKETVDVFQRYNITETPTFIIFHDSTELARLVGAPDGGIVGLLDWAEAAAEALEPGNTGDLDERRNTLTVEPLAVMALFTAGIMMAASPCVLPLLAAYTALSAPHASTHRLARFSVTLASVMAGGLAVATLFLLAGEAVADASTVLGATAGVTLFAAGLLEILGVPAYTRLKVLRGRGLAYMGLIYGLLSLQCSLPLAAGALFSIASTGATASGLASMLAFVLGLGLPPALASAGMAQRTLNSMSGGRARQAVSAILSASGIVLAASSIGVIGW